MRTKGTDPHEVFSAGSSALQGAGARPSVGAFWVRKGRLDPAAWPTARRGCQAPRGGCTEALCAWSHYLALTLPGILICHRIAGLINLFRNKHGKPGSRPLCDAARQGQLAEGRGLLPPMLYYFW